jgi:hypothetical protein
MKPVMFDVPARAIKLRAGRSSRWGLLAADTEATGFKKPLQGYIE